VVREKRLEHKGELRGKLGRTMMLAMELLRLLAKGTSQDEAT